MYLHSYFLYDISDVKCSLHLNLPNEYHFCFKITDQNLSSLPFFYTHLLHSSIKPGFCFHIDIKEKKVEEINQFIQEYLIPSFFHYQYKYDSFSSPFILASASTSSNAPFLSILNCAGREQGFPNISPLTVKKYHLISTLNADDKTVVEHYANTLMKIKDFNEPIFFQINSIDEISPFLLKLNRAEIILAAKHHQLMQFFIDYTKLYEDRRQLSFQNGVLAQSLESLSKYGSDINEPGSFYKKKIADIVNFYKNEYEILPLWYKRLGHILKVITGKRTFRSLYDDNSKKYKL